MQPLQVTLVSRVRLNPYVSLLAEALAAREPQGRFDQARELSLPAALLPWGRRRVWHLHWPELLYRAPHPLWAGLRWVRLIGLLALFRASGGRLVYTVHNLHLHEEAYPFLERWTDRLLFAWAAGIHVHDAQAQAGVARQWGRDDAVVIAHGNYVGAYPDACRRSEARERLGLPPQARVFLFLGGLRRYKGLEELVEAFVPLAQKERDAWLLVMGHAHEPAFAAELAERLQGLGQVRFAPGHVPDEELQFPMRAADFAVLPYRRATTSGAAILALSFGLPLIAPAIGPFPELLADGGGVLYDPETPDGLAGALQAALAADGAALAGQAAAAAARLDWGDLAQGHLALYRRVVGAGGRP
ncbi:MAG: glycosyltransferase family 4 protein [Chloroflexi bacterium]|nr:glycosyltransferase family 4 protein [Chloroflexota bacterium]